MPKSKTKMSMKELNDEIEGQFLDGKNSKEFDDVVHSLRELNTLYDTQLSTISATKVFEARQELLESCQKYMDTHKHAWSEKGKYRKDLIGQLSDLTKSENPEVYRDPDLLKGKLEQTGNKKVTWRDAMADVEDFPEVWMKSNSLIEKHMIT